ncbi:MAG: nuclear transport factor 2 family protein [Proteobacteria bacterium]|nr:nuclear transport factor 2 family protein [Pseudomonadota bacterium]
MKIEGVWHISSNLRITFTFIEEDGNWKIIHLHASFPTLD